MQGKKGQTLTHRKGRRSPCCAVLIRQFYGPLRLGRLQQEPPQLNGLFFDRQPLIALQRPDSRSQTP